MSLFRCFNNPSGGGEEAYSQINGILMAEDLTKVTCSSSASSYNAAAWKAFDDEIDQRFYAWVGEPSASGPDWLAYHFDGMKIIQKVILYVTNDYQTWTGDVKIQGSTDGTTWVDISNDTTITAINNTISKYTIMCNKLTNWNVNPYQHIRFYSSTKTHGGAFQPMIMIEEMQIIGKEAPEHGLVKSGTFTSASTQYGKIEIDCGFKPDVVIVWMQFTGDAQTPTTGWTTAMAIRDTSYSMWDLRPMEDVCYRITLGSKNGETGISDLTDTGFKYRSNGSNTRNRACQYTAIKY